MGWAAMGRAARERKRLLTAWNRLHPAQHGSGKGGAGVASGSVWARRLFLSDAPTSAFLCKHSLLKNQQLPGKNPAICFGKKGSTPEPWAQVATFPS